MVGVYNQALQYMLFPDWRRCLKFYGAQKNLVTGKISGRLGTMFKRYDVLGINYAKSAYMITVVV
jgi:hypothetical protein